MYTGLTLSISAEAVSTIAPESLQRPYQHFFNKQVNKWTIAPILEMEETRPRLIQVKSTLKFLSFVCVCVCVHFYFNESTMNKNDKWCFRSWSGGACLFCWAETSAMKDTAPPFLAWGQHGMEGGRPMAAFWTEVKSSTFHSDSDLGQITLPRFSPLQTARNYLN